MAGIGFALSKLSSQNNLAGHSMATGHAIMVTAGPWIVIMVGLALISWLGVPLVGLEMTTTFRVLVIYCFALSLVVTAPIALELNLRVSAQLFDRRFDQVHGIYNGALGVAALITVVLAWVLFYVIIGLDMATATAATFCVLQVSLLWLTMSMVAAIRQYTTVTTGFTMGLSVSVVLGLSLASLGYGVAGLLAGFGAGLFLAFAILHGLIVQTFPGRMLRLSDGIRSLIAHPIRSRTFVIAGLSSALAVWIDKLVVWQSYEATAIAHGLIHAPRYDVPMFIAYLSIVPLMSIVSIWLETDFFVAYRKYRDIVHSGGTLRHIDAQRSEITWQTTNTIFSAFVIQIAISLVLALAGPWIVGFLGLGLETLQVLRLALIGAAFHFLFLACVGVILFVQYARAYFVLQATFLVLNGGLTYALLANPDALGLGYVIATGAAAILAYVVMVNTLKVMNRLTFIDNNPAVAG
jgi:polysaccharide biosynthesis protein PelG|tara:strand:- start:29017 stop:30411 length:1395 start_codon:yes stop_codon:yes gene_type:complete